MVIRTLYIIYANIAFPFLLLVWSGSWTLLVLFTSYARLKPMVKLFLWIWANGIFWFLGHRVHVIGREHIEPGKNYLLVINHTSMFDFPGIMAVFPRVAWLGRENLVKIPVFGQMLLAIDYIVIYPGETERSKISINTAIEKSTQIHIAIFPEGTRTLDGSMKDFKKGFTYIVRDTDLEILPVTLNGLFSWKQKYQRYITPYEKFTMVIQPPVSNQHLRTMDNETMARYMKNIIQQGLVKEISHGKN